jgi:hypothetical protein
MTTVGSRSRALPCSRDFRLVCLFRRSEPDRRLGLAVGRDPGLGTLAARGCCLRSCLTRSRCPRDWLRAHRPLRRLGWPGCRCSRARLLCLGRLRAFVGHVRNPFSFKGLRRFGQGPMSDVLIRMALAVKQLRRLRRSRLRSRQVGPSPPGRRSRQAGRPDCAGRSEAR